LYKTNGKKVSLKKKLETKTEPYSTLGYTTKTFSVFKDSCLVTKKGN
jgi:hypothetical protein